MWWWLATPITLARAPIDPSKKLECVSYAPFRGVQTPLIATTMIPPEQIEEDMVQLAKISRCVRTYSVQNGLDQLPRLAEKVGLKVIQGIWLGGNRNNNLVEIGRAVELIKQYPNTIESVIVGNEVLLRGEMTAPDLIGFLRIVKEQVGQTPVTYADVWEFWLKNRELFGAVDFLTIHILPYWEDFPIRAHNAAGHIDEIRKRVAIALPGKEILIGETGWPSAGRMRDGSLPSRANQARVVSEIMALADREKFRVNLIEAYDQPWKRNLEGTVGGYWGLISADARELKYPVGEPVVNYPFWKYQLAAGLLLTTLVFLTAMMALRRKPWSPRPITWVTVAISATAAGALLGVAVDKVLYETYGQGMWRWGTLLAAGILSPLLCAHAAVTGRSLPSFVQLLGPKHWRSGTNSVLLGLVLIATVVIAGETALGFVFDPRYRDFPFAALTMAVVPFAGLMTVNRPQTGLRPIPEGLFAGLLVLSVAYIAFNEGGNNWQSLWTCAIYVLFAITLWRARAEPNPA